MSARSSPTGGARRIVLERDDLTPEERSAGQAILDNLFIVGDVPCPPDMFTLSTEAEIDELVDVDRDYVGSDCKATEFLEL